MAISVIQAVSGQATSGTSFNISISAPNPANSLVILTDALAATPHVAHTGSTFSPIYQDFLNAHQPAVYASTTTGTATTVTISNLASSPGGCAVVFEISGLGTSPTQDTLSAHDALTSPTASGSFTTTNANDIILGLHCSSPMSSGTDIIVTLSSPWNTAGSVINGSTTLWSVYGFYQIVSSTGAFNPSVAHSNTTIDHLTLGYSIKGVLAALHSATLLGVG